jgi:NADH-quinone oxidoreductase subunit L
MALPIVVLALLSAVGGLLNVPLRGLTWLERWLEPVFRGVHQPTPSSFGDAAALTAAAFGFGTVGIVVAFLAYRRGLRTPAADPLRDHLGPAADLVGHGYYYDATISAATDGPVRATAEFLGRDVDQAVVDGAVNGTAHLIREAAVALRHVQSGFVRRYAVGIALGTAALLFFFLAYAGR